MKKFIISLICIMSLQGCAYQTVSAWDIEDAANKCNGLENVVEIQAYFSKTEEVICKNGNTFHLHRSQQ